MPDLPIGFFLHTPFPSYDVFRTLPTRWRRAILEGILGADLVGFHTLDYTQHFLRCILRILGIEHNFGQVLIDGERALRVDTFPIYIYCEQIHLHVKSATVHPPSPPLRDKRVSPPGIPSIPRLGY